MRVRGHAGAALGENGRYRVRHGSSSNLAPLLRTFEVLFPVRVHHDVGGTLLAASGSLDEALVEGYAYALDLVVAVLVHHVLVLLLRALLCGSIGRNLLDFDLDVRLDLDLRGLAGSSPVDPGPDFVAGGVEDLDPLVPLVALAGPQGALPAAEACDLGLGEAEVVEGLEEAGVVGETAQALAVGRMRVVEAGIAGLNGVERAVEGGRLDAHLADEVLAEVGGEGGGVLGARVREEVVVDQDGDGGFAMHGGGRRGRECGRKRCRHAARRAERSICLGPGGEIAGLGSGKGPKAERRVDFSCGFLGAADAPEREAKCQGRGTRGSGETEVEIE